MREITEKDVTLLVTIAYHEEGPASVLHMLAQLCEKDIDRCVLPEMQTMLAKWSKDLKTLRDQMGVDIEKIAPDTGGSHATH